MKEQTMDCERKLLLRIFILIMSAVRLRRQLTKTATRCTAFLLFVFCMQVYAQQAPVEQVPTFILKPKWNDPVEIRNGIRAWKWSLAPLFVNAGVDAYSSFSHREVSPLLRSGPDKRFGARGAVILAGSTGVTVLVERWLIHRNPAYIKAFYPLNILLSTAHGVAATLNMHTHKRQ